MSSVKEQYLEGFLNKAGKHSFQAWKKRWFVLKGTTVRYYPNQDVSESNTLGAIDMCQVTLLGMSRSVKYGFEISTRTRTYYLSARSDEDREKWMHALQEAMNVACKKDTTQNITTYETINDGQGKELRQSSSKMTVDDWTAKTDNSFEPVYETVSVANRDSGGDIEKIMAEAELMSSLENTKEEERKKFKQEIIEGASHSPKLGRSANLSSDIRLPSVQESESEDDVDGSEPAYEGVGMALSKLSMDSLDSIDLLGIIEEYEDDEDEKVPDDPNGRDDADIGLTTLEEKVANAADSVDGLTRDALQIPKDKTYAIEQVKELLGIDENYRCSVSLQDIRKMYGIHLKSDEEFPAFELLRQVVGMKD